MRPKKKGAEGLVHPPGRASTTRFRLIPDFTPSGCFFSSKSRVFAKKKKKKTNFGGLGRGVNILGKMLQDEAHEGAPPPCAVTRSYRQKGANR